MSRAKLLAFLVSGAGFLTTPAAVYAAGFANTAQSGVATAMAGAGVGNPNEPNINYYNPASMAFQDQIRAYAGVTLLVPSVKHTPASSTAGQGEVKTEDAVFPPPNLSLTIPFANNYAVGLGVTLPWGLAIDWPEDWYGRETFVGQELQTVNINPNFAYRLPGLDLSLSVGAQLVFGKVVQKKAIIASSEKEFDVKLGGNGFGIGGAASLMYKPTKDVTLGFAYRSRVKINFDGVIHFNNPAGTAFENILIDQDVSTNLTVPDTFNLGVGWLVFDKLFVTADVSYIMWSTYDRIVVEFSEQSPQAQPGQDPRKPDQVSISDWHDSMAFRIGAEYDVLKNLSLRAGFAYDMTPVPDDTVGPSLPDNNRTVIALGAGYEVSGFRADAGYQLVMVGERKIDRGTPVDGVYKMGAHVVSMNVGYDF